MMNIISEKEIDERRHQLGYELEKYEEIIQNIGKLCEDLESENCSLRKGIMEREQRILILLEENKGIKELKLE